MARVWMDQGGTFTDVVRVSDDGVMRIEKVLSQTACLTELADGAADVRRGTTAATNALLEGTTPPVLLITNAGFEDLPWIGDGRRPSLFERNIQRAKPLCDAVLGVGGRVGADGRLVAPLDVDEAALRTHREAGITAVAVVFIHSPLNPNAERRVGELCEAIGFESISLGHQVAPSRGFLARLQTTLADAALSPLLPRAPGLYIRSDGGLSTAEEWTGAQSILSGPAGGVVGTAAIAKAAGLDMAFGLDMGGTSTDVCRVAGGVTRRDHIDIAGMRLRVPSLSLETVASGGGSILSLPDGVMAVGPTSAGALPGPAAYGRGGPATLTDAEAVLGRLPEFPHVCGPDRDSPLDVDAAAAAIHDLQTGLALEDAAQGFKAVAAETAARAVRSMAASLGVDAAQHGLVAFGGAGPGHACAIAEALGIKTVIIPRLAGVFSAVGIGRSSRRAEQVVIVHTSIRDALDQALRALPFDGEVTARIAARHRGTSHVLEIDLVDGSAADDTALSPDQRAAFDAAHAARFGFARPDQPVEALEVRVSVEAQPPDVPWASASPSRPEATTRAWFGTWRSVPLLDMTRADGLQGPAILTGGGCTVTVDPGWRVTVDEGFIRLDFEGTSAPSLGTGFHPIHTAIFASRVMAIAEQMGERLARLSRSVSIRERHDFSCAIFDADGQLVANAPHVPIHLGAMGETVADLIDQQGEALQSGTTWASNDPYAGGSHLPDITVVRPIFRGGTRVAFVACRGHHVDVGGLSPGSMPPHSTHIDHEGLRLRNHRLADASGFHCPELPGCRQPDELRADLLAQVAAVAMGESAMTALMREIGLPTMHAQMAHLMGAASRAVARALQRRGGSHRASEVLDDGTVIAVEIAIEGDRGHVHLNAPAHSGNLNTPRAVANAAVLYVLRSLVDEPHQLLNAGSLRPVQIQVNAGGLFDPRHPAAVVGGNVESSQRLVDALLVALGAQAASQGTMNNLTVGTRTGVWYETIPGGGGAGPDFPGADAVQLHMTNTRATDVEVLETRFPVRLERMAIRRGSGGDGAQPGGCGLVKEWVFLDHAEVSLLAERRAAGAPGASGGRPGLPGVDQINTGAGWEPMPTLWRASAGDRLRILTPGGGGFGQTD